MDGRNFGDFFVSPRRDPLETTHALLQLHYSRSTAGQKTVVINDPRLPPVNAAPVKKKRSAELHVESSEKC